MSSNIHLFHTSQDRPVWIIESQRTAYVFGLDQHGYLQHMYWGTRLINDTDYGEPGPFPARGDRPEGRSQEEFPVWGDLNFNEPCLKATFADGVRGMALEYEGHNTREFEGGSELTVTMRDPHYALIVHLLYRVFPEFDVIERRAIIENTGSDPVMLERIMTAAWNFPQHDHYRLLSLDGEWGQELSIQENTLQLGRYVIERRRGARGHDAQPWFAIDDGAASETHGEVWCGALAYSSNFKLIAQRNTSNQVIMTGGISDFDFAWKLDAGERFEAPAFVGVYSGEGYGHASRMLHGYQVNHVLPQPFNRQVRPVLYNSWYVTLFDVNVENQSEAAEKAAQLGIELFVMDDGWFGQRKDDYAGLGDWYVDKDKFPDGLKPLIDRVKALGMDFGIWVEPEMVNPDSDLYREHPDWVYHFPNRLRSEARHQLVLNVARPDVQAFIFDFMDDLLSNNDIKFIKWDMNRPISEPGWPDAPDGRDREVWVRHAQGLYDIFARLREKHPQVIFESCSGGGGRIDLGIMRYVEQFWMSDNTDPFDQLFMTEGFSLGYTLASKMSWVTDPIHINNRRQPSLEYTFHSAMLGTMGVGAQLLNWSDETMAQAADLIAFYKEVRETLQFGYFYRLRSPRASDLAAFQFVHPSGHESVVFLFLHSSKYGPHRITLPLQGLDESAVYILDESATPISGKALMHKGIPVEMSGDFVSRVIHIKRATTEAH